MVVVICCRLELSLWPAPGSSVNTHGNVCY